MQPFSEFMLGRRDAPLFRWWFCERVVYCLLVGMLLGGFGKPAELGKADPESDLGVGREFPYEDREAG